MDLIVINGSSLKGSDQIALENRRTTLKEGMMTTKDLCYNGSQEEN